MKPQAQALATLGGCAMAWSIISWLRVLQVGTLRVDDLMTVSAATRLWPQLAFGVFATVFAWRFWWLLRNVRSLHGLLAGAIILHLVAALAMPLTSNDVFSNLAYGHLLATGHNPYLTTPHALPPSDAYGSLVANRWRDTPMVYGPIIATFCAPSGWFARVWAALLAWKLSMIVVDLAAICGAYRICHSRFQPQRAARSFVLFAYSPVMVWEISGQAHNDGLLVLATVAFLWALLDERQWLAILCLSAAVFAKLAAVVLLLLYLVYVFRFNKMRAIAMTMVVGLFGIAVSLPYWRNVQSLQGPLQTLGGHASRTSRSLADLAVLTAAPFGSAATNFVYEVFWIGGMGGLSWLLVRAASQIRQAHDVIHWSLVVLGAYCLLAAPWFQPWYVTWLLPLALVHRDVHWQRTSAWYAALTPIQYIVPLDPATTLAINAVVLKRVCQ
jgi:hypothetical protein